MAKKSGSKPPFVDTTQIIERLNTKDLGKLGNISKVLKFYRIIA